MNKIFTVPNYKIGEYRRALQESTKSGANAFNPKRIWGEPIDMFFVKLTTDNQDGTYEGIEQIPIEGSAGAGRVCDWDNRTTRVHTWSNTGPYDDFVHPPLCEIESRPTGSGQTVQVFKLKAVRDVDGNIIYNERYVAILNSPWCKVRIETNGPDFVGNQLDGGGFQWPSANGLQLQEISGRNNIFAINDFSGSSDPEHNDYKDFWVCTRWDSAANKLVSFFSIDDPFLYNCEEQPGGFGVLKENPDSSENMQTDGRYEFKRFLEYESDYYDPNGDIEGSLEIEETSDGCGLILKPKFGLNLSGQFPWTQVINVGVQKIIQHIGPAPELPEYIWLEFKVLDNSYDCTPLSGGASLADVIDAINEIKAAIKIIKIDLRGHVLVMRDCDGSSPDEPPTDDYDYWESELISNPSSLDVLPEGVG